jgi:subtilisin family serine protease
MSKKVFVTLTLITLIFITSIPVRTSAAIQIPQSEVGLPQKQPEQKISPYLKSEMKQDNTSKNELLRILIKHDPNMKTSLPKGLQILRDFKTIPLVSAKASTFEIEELAKLENVEYIYPDMKIQALNFNSQRLPVTGYSLVRDSQDMLPSARAVPDTPWFGDYPCFLNESTALIKANELWAENITGKGVVIAVLDTGINKNHPDLDDLDDNPTTCDPKVIAQQVFIEEPAWEIGDPTDYVGHGTHVASIAAGTGGTGAMGFLGTSFGTQFVNVTIKPGTERGVAPSAFLYNVKVLNSQGFGYESWIIAGIEWAVDRGADIISMSLGGPAVGRPEEDPLALALDVATEHGVVCVVAAGNSGWGYFSLDSPGFDPKVITVGASTETDRLAHFSSRGPEEYELHAKPDILALGTCVVAAYADFDYTEDTADQQIFYWELSGTSMATPHVSGAAALLLQAFHGASPYAVKSAMMLAADDLGLDPMAQGAGRLNVAKARSIMATAAGTNWAAPIPTSTIDPVQPILTSMPNLTNVKVLVENSFCAPDKMYTFINMLSLAGATISYGSGPYANHNLVNVTTRKPLYDVFILSEPNRVDEVALPPSVLGFYVRQNGTVLLTGDKPNVCMNYTRWTKQWGIGWDNRAIGGFSTNITSHAITQGISKVYFSSPITSLTLNATSSPSPKCVIWDPLFPGVAVWEAQAPDRGKVVVLSDDGVLMNQYLSTADNMALGFNIIKWFTNTSNIHLTGVEKRLDPAIESDHSYAAPADVWFPVNAPGASWVSVHFAEIEVEESYDYVGIYDQFMNPIEYFSGHYENLWTGPVLGSVLWIRLKSDSSVEDWGFLADAYRYGSIGPASVHEIGLGATWSNHVVANSTLMMSVTMRNFGDYTEDVMLRITVLNSTGGRVVDNWNFRNITIAPGGNIVTQVSPHNMLNATTHCRNAGTQDYVFNVIGTIFNSTSGRPPYREIDVGNNQVTGEISAVPKTARTGLNPLLSIITPKRIASDSAPLITMYPKDFTMHNVTAFVSGGQLEKARFEIMGNVTEVADFVNVTAFAKHFFGEVSGEWISDASPAYFTPNMAAAIGDTLPVGNASAPTMLSAELQIYISPNTPAGSYVGTVQLLNGTNTLASADLIFEVRNPKGKILWEDYFNDYRISQNGPYWGTDCERLWGGAFTRSDQGSVGLFDWWKLVANAGFDVDSLHQQLHFDEHTGFLGTATIDPMQVIAYGDYDTLFLDDVDYAFTFEEVTVFQQLYETGRMNFAVLFNDGSASIDLFTTNYGISNRMPYANGTPQLPSPMIDMLVTGVDKSHPIFHDVENFTLTMYPYEMGYYLRAGPLLYSDHYLQSKGTSRGIATGTDDFGALYGSGYVVAVNELQATQHVTSRMVVVSDGNMFESLEYEDYVIWINLYLINGNNTMVSRVDTDRFAVNMLDWLVPQFSNAPPQISSATVTPSALTVGESASVDVVASDPENDNLAVTVAVRRPDNTWNNVTASIIGGHWLAEPILDTVGSHKVYAVVSDGFGATISMPIGTVEASIPINDPPKITSVSISPQKVIQNQTVFITVIGEDTEDSNPEATNITITAPDGTAYNYSSANTGFTNLIFNTTGMPAGIYSIHVAMQDSQGAKTSTEVGSFEVEKAPEPIAAEFPVEVAGLGVGILTLVMLIVIVLLLLRRFKASAPISSTPAA